MMQNMGTPIAPEDWPTVTSYLTIVRFDPKTEKFQTWAIPGGGDIVRNMDVTPDGNPVTANSLVNQVGLVEIK